MRIVVLDNVLLAPGHDVYILVNSSVTYSVIRVRRGKTAGLFHSFCKIIIMHDLDKSPFVFERLYLCN